MKNMNFGYSNQVGMEIRDGLSPLFSLAKIQVMYTNDVVNGTIFSKDAIIKSLHTIYNIPIVGSYVREKDNFLGHEGELVLEDNQIDYLSTTVPIGVVPETANVYFEEQIDSYGIPRDYLVIDGAFIWNRDRKLVNSLKNNVYGQSMEITIEDSTPLPDGSYLVNDFYFAGLCVLGISKDGAGYVQPAFTDAKIQTFSIDKKDVELQKSLEEMFKECQYALETLENKKEDDSLEIKGLLSKYSLTEEELLSKVSNYADLTVEEIDAKLSEFEATPVAEPVAEPVSEPAPAVEPVVEPTVEDPIAEPAVAEPVVEEPAVEPTVENSEGEAEPVIEEPVTEPVAEPVVAEPVKKNEFEARVEELVAENFSLKEQIKALTESVSGYKKAEKNAIFETVIAQFNEQYELEELLVSALNFDEFETKEDLESKMFELVGRSAKAKAKAKAKNENFAKIPTLSTNEQVDIFAEFFGK